MSFDMKHKARNEALKKLRGALSKEGGKGYGEGMSAKVVAKDPESLQEGLEKAAELIEQSEEGPNYDDMSREELLEALKNK
jgi:hypothetical protein